MLWMPMLRFRLVWMSLVGMLLCLKCYTDSLAPKISDLSFGGTQLRCTGVRSFSSADYFLNSPTRLVDTFTASSGFWLYEPAVRLRSDLSLRSAGLSKCSR